MYLNSAHNEHYTKSVLQRILTYNHTSYYIKGALSLVLPQVGKLTIMMRNHLEGYNTNTNDS